MSIHLVIIDAMNLIRRVHSAQPDLNDIERTARTCTRTVQNIIKQAEPTHIVAVFDHLSDDKGWRAQICPEYKQGRKPMHDALKNGLDQIQDAFMACGVDSLLSEGDEADDMIATLALKVAQHKGLVSIISTDKGYCQLLAPYIQIRDYFQERWLNHAFIEKEFGVRPEQLTDYWGLAGINSSNIAGVAGIGAKSATQLLTQYETIAQIYAAIDEIPSKWQKKLLNQEKTAQNCKQVATLKNDIQLGFNLQDIRFVAPLNQNTPSRYSD